MLDTVHTMLLVAAVVLLLIDAFGFAKLPRVQLTPLALALVVLTLII